MTAIDPLMQSVTAPAVSTSLPHPRQNLPPEQLSAVAQKSPGFSQIDPGSGERKSGASEQELRQTLNAINQKLAGSNDAISFGYEEKLGRLYVQVTDKRSGEVIRQIPSREFMQHQIAMRELIGLILDRQV